MNFTEIARVMHKKTGKSVATLVRQFANDPRIEPYLIKDKNGKICGLQEAGIEALRNVGYQKAPRVDLNLLEAKHEAELLQVKIDSLERLNAMQEKTIERLQEDNEQLRAELKQYQTMGFFKRLLGYRK